MTPLRFLSSLLVLLALTCAGATARAADAGANPCGNFDFSSGISCKIETSGGCTADCTTLKVEAACKGGCTATADSMCVNNCGTQCVANCDPAHLDCFVGCHAECDQPTMFDCKAKNPNADCTAEAKAQCDVHCTDACQIPPTNCQEHCNKCCTGSCTTQVNFDCDMSCFVNAQGGCNVQCTKPEGAIFCNGQYVHADDVQSCISYLATQGVNVDVSARASATCDLTGCHGAGSAVGQGGACSASPGSSAGTGGLWVGALAFGLTGIVARARRRKPAR